MPPPLARERRLYAFGAVRKVFELNTFFAEFGSLYPIPVFSRAVTNRRISCSHEHFLAFALPDVAAALYGNLSKSSIVVARRTTRESE